MPKYSTVIDFSKRRLLYSSWYNQGPNRQHPVIQFAFTQLPPPITFDRFSAATPVELWGADAARFANRAYEFEIVNVGGIVVATGRFTKLATAGSRANSWLISGYSVNIGNTDGSDYIVGVASQNLNVPSPVLRINLFDADGPETFSVWGRVERTESVAGALSVASGDSLARTVTVQCVYDPRIEPAIRATVGGVTYQVAAINTIEIERTLELDLLRSI